LAPQALWLSPRPAPDRAAPRGTTGLAALPARVCSAMPGLSKTDAGSKLQTSFPQTDCSFHRTTLLFAILLSPHSLLCARVPPLLLSPSPTPFSPPAPPSSTCGKLLEGSVFPPNRGRSLAAAFVFLHSQGGIPRVGCGDATRSGEGGEGSSACFPSTNQAPGNHC